MLVEPVCLILGAGFLAHDTFAVNPDAVATAGAAFAVRKEVEPEALSIVLEGPGGEALRAVAQLAAGQSAVEALSMTACPAAAIRVALIDSTGREPPEGVVLWPPERLDAGGGPAPEVARTLRELVGLAVPRPVAPQRHPVSVLRLSGQTDEAILLTAAFRSAWTSWIHLSASVYLASDDPDVLARMTALEGTEVLGEGVELGRLRLVEGALPQGARALGDGVGGQLALCQSGTGDGVTWHESRFARID